MPVPKISTPSKNRHYLDSYLAWLKRQPLSAQSKRAYASRVNAFIGFLEGSNNDISAIIEQQNEGEYILREYKRNLKRSRKLLPSSVNAALTAVDHFFQFLGLPSAKIAREDLPLEAPRALTPDEQKRFRAASRNQKRALDRAVVSLLLNTGMRIGECAALDIADVCIAGRKCQVIIRNGKGDRYREIPLNEDARDAIRDWALERNRRFANREIRDALFVNPQGRRMSATSLDRIVRKTGNACGIALSAHVLRHTCLTNLVRKGHDLVLVAEIGGHKRLETTRRYSLPTAHDKQRALASLTEISQ
jgi:integrase/recombinase XerC